MAYGAHPDADATALERLLLTSGILGDQQISVARAAQARTGAPFDEVLVSLGLVSESRKRNR